MIFVFFLPGPVPASACSCARRTPCLKNASADAVFIGKIKGVKYGNSNVHQVEIEKNFSGMENRKTVEVYTDGVTSCFFSMQEGESYLIFANTGEKTGLVTTHYCAGTKKLADSKEELEFLESLKDAGDGRGILKGSILEHDLKNKFEAEPWKPKEIDKVYLVSEKGEKFEADIEPDGKYSFDNLTGGWYEATIFVPDRLIASEEMEDDYVYREGFREIKRRIKVPGSGCPAINYYSVRLNGVISGRVVDAGDRPSKRIPVTLFRFDNADDMPEENYKVWTDDEGFYIAKGLPPGRYMLGFGIDHSLYINSDFAGYLPTYYPNNSRKTETEILNLGVAERLTEKNIKLFPELGRRKITGRVVYVKIDPNGNFELEAFEKTEYFILGWKHDSPDWKTRKVIFSSDCYKIPISGNVRPLEIVMKKGSGNCDGTKFKNE
jgi:hypothetical protein